MVSPFLSMYRALRQFLLFPVIRMDLVVRELFSTKLAHPSAQGPADRQEAFRPRSGNS